MRKRRFRDPFFLLLLTRPALRTHLYWSCWVVLGLRPTCGDYLFAVPDKVSPAQETVKELNPCHTFRLSRRGDSDDGKNLSPEAAKASEDSQPAEAASAMVTDPPAKTTVAKDTPARSTRPLPVFGPRRNRHRCTTSIRHHPINRKTGLPHFFGMPLPVKSNWPAHTISLRNADTHAP